MRHRPLVLAAGCLVLLPWLNLSCGDDGDGGGNPSPSGGQPEKGGSGGSGADATGGKSSSGAPSGGKGQAGASDAGAGGEVRPGSGGASGAGAAQGGSAGDATEPPAGCEAPSAGPVRPYFEVPGADGAELADFFRLPFPNDIRRSEDGLDLTGYPTLGVAAVQLYVDAIQDNDTAWGSDPTVFFRFSGALSPESFENGSALEFVDVTESADSFGTSVGLSHFYSHDATNHVCDNWLAVRRPHGEPLLPGHTYAVYVTTQLRANDGSALAAAPQFQSVIADEKPRDAALAAAHAAYAPLRAYLDDRDIDPATIASAAVFTVGELTQRMTELVEATESEPPPSVNGEWVLCRDGVESPCPQRDGTRNCGSQSAAFDEYHAIVSLPSYQRGTPPFFKAADGGGIDVSQPPEWIDVCMALTVPTGAVPADGFPLVISAHGTGGSFRSHVIEHNNARALSSGDVKFAVLGIDQVSHGTRRGTSPIPPEYLFFNFQNPAAARGNPLQGALDQLSLARFAETLDGTGAEPVKIDATRMVFFGHSQGGTEGSLAIPYGDRFRAAVLSGNGASLQRALLTKTSPLDLRTTLATIIKDDSLNQGDYPAEYHPVLSLAQQWIDPADPLNFARHVALDPLPGHAAIHTFQTYGLHDTYSPPLTLGVYALAGGFAHVSPELEPLGRLESPPLAGNVNGVTLGFRQYSPPDGQDGHFVAFSVPDANADVIRFLSMAVSGETPEIGR